MLKTKELRGQTGGFAVDFFRDKLRTLDPIAQVLDGLAPVESLDQFRPARERGIDPTGEIRRSFPRLREKSGKIFLSSLTPGQWSQSEMILSPEDPWEYGEKYLIFPQGEEFLDIVG